MRLQIEKGVYGGSGLAHTPEGQTVFVPFTLPQEWVEAEPGSAQGRAPEIELRSVLEASAERVSPRCRHFGVCGGCQYQHASYPEQLAIKSAILQETLQRAGVLHRPSIAVHADDPWEYRNRIRLRVATDRGDTIRVGYNLRSSDQFLPIAECPIAAPLLWRAAEEIEALAAEAGPAAVWVRASAEIELSCTNDQRRLQILLLLREQPGRRFELFGRQLADRIPELVGTGAIPADTRARRSSAVSASWGADGLPMTIAGRSYWVSRGGFFQVNRKLAEDLVRLVAGSRSGALAWDLFSGVGLFARALAESFREVTAVEASAVASADLDRARVASVRSIAQPVAAFLRQAALERDRPDLVVLDPPRAGLGVEGATLLSRISPAEIVYVSCDPTTLGRDLRVMVDSGYNLAELHLVDLFPQTFHLETVAVLRRS